MKISQLFSVTITTIVFGFTSGVSILEDPPSFLQRLIQSLESQSKTGSESFYDTASSSIFIPKLMNSLSQDYDAMLSYNADQPKHHVRRGASYKHKPRTRWHKMRCLKDKYGRCASVSKCGFMSPVDIISQNRRFGCRRIHKLGEARKW